MIFGQNSTRTSLQVESTNKSKDLRKNHQAPFLFVIAMSHFFPIVEAVFSIWPTMRAIYAINSSNSRFTDVQQETEDCNRMFAESGSVAVYRALKDNHMSSMCSSLSPSVSVVDFSSITDTIEHHKGEEEEEDEVLDGEKYRVSNDTENEDGEQEQEPPVPSCLPAVGGNSSVPSKQDLADVTVASSSDGHDNSTTDNDEVIRLSLFCCCCC